MAVVGKAEVRPPAPLQVQLESWGLTAGVAFELEPGSIHLFEKYALRTSQTPCCVLDVQWLEKLDKLPILPSLISVNTKHVNVNVAHYLDVGLR